MKVNQLIQELNVAAQKYGDVDVVLGLDGTKPVGSVEVADSPDGPFLVLAGKELEKKDVEKEETPKKTKEEKPKASPTPSEDQEKPKEPNL